MKYIIAMLVLFSICSSVLGQVEPVEPTALPVIKYDVELLKSPSSTWQLIPDLSYTVKSGSVGIHKFLSVWGVLNWEATACDSSVDQPKIVTFNFNYIPSGLFDIIRVRIRGYIEPESPFAIKEWSETSWWVQVYRIGKPGKAIIK